jgi:hypothetical protein
VSLQSMSAVRAQAADRPTLGVIADILCDAELAVRRDWENVASSHRPSGRTHNQSKGSGKWQPFC